MGHLLLRPDFLSLVEKDSLARNPEAYSCIERNDSIKGLGGFSGSQITVSFSRHCLGAYAIQTPDTCCVGKLIVPWWPDRLMAPVLG